MLRLLIALSVSIVLVSSAAHAGYYECDATKLASENLCYFVKGPNNPWAALVPHNLNRSVGADGYRKIVDPTGTEIKLSPKPWSNGYVLKKSETEITGSAWKYVESFELGAPLRDAMMFNPKSLTENLAEWTKLTKALVDCKVKDADENATAGTIWGVDSIYALMKDPKNYQDVQKSILRFLEEGIIDLACVMTDFGATSPPLAAMERCIHMKTKAPPANCWQSAYDAMYPADSATTPPTTAGATTPPTTAGATTPPTTAGATTPPTTAGATTPPTTAGATTPPTADPAESGASYTSLSLSLFAVLLSVVFL